MIGASAYPDIVRVLAPILAALDLSILVYFVAINAVIGACLGDDRLVIDSLDNASVTVVDVDDRGGVKLVERGRQADTLIR